MNVVNVKYYVINMILIHTDYFMLHFLFKFFFVKKYKQVKFINVLFIFYITFKIYFKFKINYTTSFLLRFNCF